MVGLIIILFEKLGNLCSKYHEVVMSSSPTLPLGGYVGYERDERRRNPIGVETDLISTPRVASAATLGWRSQPLRGLRTSFVAISSSLAIAN
jgi:hypothetical protein